MDPCSVPDEAQVKEIWFAFNLVGNFIHNKNLQPGGRVDKFIAWVEMAQAAYPANPYMSLFLSLAYLIKGDSKKCREYRSKAVLHQKTEYWRNRFAAFGLTKVLHHFPQGRSEAFKTIENLRHSTSCFFPTDPAPSPFQPS
jgi:hypothetical protein